MLNLPIQNVVDINDFYVEIRSKTIDKVSKSRLKAEVKNFLTDNKIDEIFVSSPNRLFEIHEELIQKIGASCSVKEYNKYLVVRKKKKLSVADKSLIKKYDWTVKQLSKIFDYDKLISGKKTVSYRLAKMIGRNTCTYCNRLYTFTVVRKDENTGRVNNSTRITKPQFDHWLSKKKYPLFALSFYNLIPSCSVCNSSIKGEDNYTLKTHVHPYIVQPNEKFKFSYIKKAGNKNEVVLRFHGSKVKKTMEDLKIKEIYDEHSDFELQDILDLKYKYSENYLDVLFNKTFNLSEVKKKDAYRMLFGVEINSSDFHKRPFSKFKYDILKELGVIR